MTSSFTLTRAPLPPARRAAPRAAWRARPGGFSPPASPFAASMRRRRAMTMPLSVAMRCSAGRLAMTPMLSWIAASARPLPARRRRCIAPSAPRGRSGNRCAGSPPAGSCPYQRQYGSEARFPLRWSLPVVDRVLEDLRPAIVILDHGGGIDELQLVALELWRDAPVGDDVAHLRHQRLAIAEHEFVEERGGLRMRRARRHSYGVGGGDRWRERDPVDRCTRAALLLRQIAVQSKSEGHVTGDNEVGEQCAAHSHLQALGRECTEELEPLRFTHRLHERVEPILLLAFDGDAALPARMQQIDVRFGQIGFVH